MLTTLKTKILPVSALFLLGALGYGALEILWRGYTHYSMLIAGGICLLILYRLSLSSAPFFWLSVAGSAAITAVELLFGLVFNLWLGMRVWDYSNKDMHLWGQICLRQSLLWCVLSAVVIIACRELKKASEKVGIFKI